MFFPTKLLLAVVYLAGCTSYEPTESLPVIDNGVTESWKSLKPTHEGFHIPGASMPVWSSIRTSPLIDGDRLYVPYDSVIQCLRVSDGELIWSSSITDASDVKPWADLWADDLILENGRLYVVTGLGSILCFDAHDGGRIWKQVYTSGGFGAEFNRYSQSEDALYVSTNRELEVLKISKATGQIIWRSSGAAITSVSEYTAGAWLGAPSYYQGKVFVSVKYGGSQWQGRVWHDGSAAAFDDQNGKLIWTKVIPPPDSSVGYPHPEKLQETMGGRAIVPYEGGILFTAGHNIVRMDLKGNIEWRRTGHIDGYVNLFTITPLIHNGRMYVLDNTLLSSLDPVTGEVFWTKMFTRREKDEYTFHSPLQVSGNSIFSVTDDYRVFGADLLSGATNYAVDLSPHLYKYKEGEFLLLGGIRVTEGQIFGIDRQNVYCWRRL